MNLQMLNKNLTESFKTVRDMVPKMAEFLTDQLFSYIFMYHLKQFQMLFPINNPQMILTFCKKFLNRTYTDDSLETFTEIIEEDTIDLLREKGYTLSQLNDKSQREKALTKLKIEGRDAQLINDYFDGLPKFKIGEIKTFVKDCDNIEVGDLGTIQIELKLENFDNQLVATNIARTQFEYPNQSATVKKQPKLYVVVTEKSGKVLMYSKVKMNRFVKSKEGEEREEDAKSGEIKLKESIVIEGKTMFLTEGERKIVVQIYNDSYFFIDNDLEKDTMIKVEAKKQPQEEMKKTEDVKVDDNESVDEGKNIINSNFFIDPDKHSQYESEEDHGEWEIINK